MKPFLRNLRAEQKVWAIVEENIAGNEVLVSFSGELVRVENKTKKNFRIGQRVLLIVSSIQPLEFKIVTHQASGSKQSIDISI